MARLETDGVGGPAAPGGPRTAQNQGFATTSFLKGANAAYLEGLLDAYEADPASVSPEWGRFFAELGVVPGAAEQGILARAPHEGVATVAADQAVGAVAAEQRIGTG